MSVNKTLARAIILNQASREGNIVYGTRSVNQQIPKFMKKKTKDYDIIAKNPEKQAKELIKELNKAFNGNRFILKKGRYSRTWKVKDAVTGETIADYTRPSRTPKTKNILGVKYADLEFSERKIKKILKDESSKYRWDKDIDTLKRIKAGKIKVW